MGVVKQKDVKQDKRQKPKGAIERSQRGMT